ncbi:MAG: hypothetical protein HW405_394 [Candidatus Berkelbacteria bacterium]|nr:hypothetical protein [Candidatus Berkelbacteria bacterium]
MDELTKSNGGKMRLKILLIILGILVIIFGIVFWQYGPSSQAAKGGAKGKPKATPTATVSAKPSATGITTPTSMTTPAPTSTTSLFSDDFSSALAKWQQVYDGYGTITIQDGRLSMEPKVSTQSSETHAPLLMAGNSTWGDYVYMVRMNTVKQLRTGSPANHWEVGWITFRMQDASRSYYFLQKPNGIELGKYIPESPYQYFLYTADNPKLTFGVWNTYKIAVKGANIKIWINGTQVVDYMDPGGATGPGPWLTGKIGLYNEDAHVLYDDVLVTSN